MSLLLFYHYGSVIIPINPWNLSDSNPGYILYADDALTQPYELVP